MTWTYVLDEDALPKDRWAFVSPLGKDILIARSGADVFAVSGRCPHLGYSLEGADRFGNLIVCPFHGIGFDLQTGKCPQTDFYSLAVYPVKSEGGKLYVNLTPA